MNTAVFKKIFLVFVLLIGMFFLVSCGVDNAVVSGDKIRIAYSEPLSDFSPLGFEAKNRKYISNIYESLVRYDKSFNYDTNLAVSWGRVDDLTWEFKLRQDVSFQDGSVFAADDAIYSLNLALNDKDSQLSSLLSTVENVEKIDDFKIVIKTFDPDPLLLNKLTGVYMVPYGYSDFEKPIGTGPYTFLSKTDDVIVLERFDDYWGTAPFYKEADLFYMPNVEDRLNALINGDIDVLANVPPQYVSTLEEAGIDLQVFPSLEVSYLMLNFKKTFSDSDLRKAVWYAIGTDYSDEFGRGFLVPSSQFAALGIFGYNTELADRAQDFELAVEARSKIEDEVNIELDVPLGLDALGERIAADLASININVTVNVLAPEEFEKKILSGTSDMYFFGWKYDLADVSDFFETVVHSNVSEYGSFNGIQYTNTYVDELIEDASKVLDVEERRVLLDSITSTVLSDQVILPLFEAQLIYGFSTNVHWSVRLDGQILASEIIGNVVQ